jgi:hypothetical protein
VRDTQSGIDLGFRFGDSAGLDFLVDVFKNWFSVSHHAFTFPLVTSSVPRLGSVGQAGAAVYGLDAPTRRRHEAVWSCPGSNRRLARQYAVHDPVAVDEQVHESRDDVQADKAEQHPGQRRVQVADIVAEPRALFHQPRQWH